MRLRAAILLALLPGMGWAAPRPAPNNGRNVVRFDGDTIDGDLQRPDGDLLSARPRPEMPSLVEPPKSFERASRRTLMAAAAALESQTVTDQDGKEGTDGRGARSSGGAR